MNKLKPVHFLWIAPLWFYFFVLALVPPRDFLLGMLFGVFGLPRWLMYFLAVFRPAGPLPIPGDLSFPAEMVVCLFYAWLCKLWISGIRPETTTSQIGAVNYQPKRPKLISLGIIFVLMPLVLHSYKVGAHGIGLISKGQFSRTASVTYFKEEPIIWSGFQGPIGVRVQFELSGAFRPGIWMQGPVLIAEDEANRFIREQSRAIPPHSLAFGWIRDQNYCFLEPPRSKEILRTSAGPLQKYTFDFYSSNLASLESPDKIYLYKLHPAPANFQDKTRLHFGNGDFDFADLLSLKMQETGGLFQKPVELERIYQRMTAEKLTNAGYTCKWTILNGGRAVLCERGEHIEKPFIPLNTAFKPSPDFSKISVCFSNAAGEPKLYGEASDALEYAGFNPRATRQNESLLDKSVIRDHLGKPEVARAIAELFGIPKAEVVTQIDPAPKYDMEVVLGKDILKKVR